MTMDLKPVKSSNIKAVGYDAAAKALTVQFQNGLMHRYEDVPPDLHTEMLGAESVGKYFNSNIRNAFKTSRVDAEEKES